MSEKDGSPFRRVGKADLRAHAFAINRVQASIDRVRVICAERGVERVATDAIVLAVQIAVTEMCTGRIEGSE